MLFLKLLYTQFLAAVLLFVAINPNVEAAPKVRVLLKPTIDIAYEDSILRPLMDAWTLTSGIEVTLDWAQSLVTNDYGAVVNSYLKTLKPDYYDIYMLDVVWIGDYGPYFQPLNNLIPKSVFDTFNPDIVVNNIVDEKYIAIPWSANYGIFFYRTDLLAKYNHTIPKTWDQLEAAARDILRGERAAGNTGLAGYLAQLDSYEGLTCNLVEWIKSTGAGPILDGDGRMTIEHENATWILSKIAGWIDDDPWLMPTGSLVHQEQAGIDGFAAGNAIFMRNWPKAIKNIETSKAFNNTGRTWSYGLLPGRYPGQSGSALGGWQLGISHQSKDATSAAKVLAFLGSKEVQRARAIAHGLLPTIPDLYNDISVCTAIKYCDLFKTVQVAVRPSASVRNYGAVSQRIYTAIHDFFAGQTKFSKDKTGTAAMLTAMSISAEKMAGTWVDPARGPPVYIESTSALSITMSSLTVIALAVNFVTAVFLFWYRSTKVVKSASFGFCSLMILGSSINLATIFVYSGYPTQITCILQPWMLSISFSLILLALLEKNWRVARIFNNPYMKRLKFSPLDFAMRAGVFLLIEAVILAVWTGVNPPLPSRVYLSTYNFATCQSSNSDFHWLMTGLLLAINGLLILAAVGMAYFTRHIRAEYNEAHKIALIVWNTASLSFIGLAILFIDALSAQVVFAIRSLIILECNIFFIVVFFFPIAKKILSKIPSRRNDGTGSKVMTMAGGSSSGSDDTKATKARMPDVGDATKHFPAPQVNSVFSTGILVGRYAKSHFALGFAAWHQYKIIYHPRDLILSLIPYDAKDGSGHTYRIKSQDVTPPAMDANNLVSFGICINETHYFTFQTPSMEAARAWVEQLGDTRKPKNPVHSTMDRSAARFNA